MTQVTEAQAAGVPSVTPVVAELRGLFHHAIQETAAGEPVRYDLFMFPLPTEQTDAAGNHQLVAMVGLYMEIKGARLGTAISGTRVMPPNGFTAASVAEHVRETLEGLRAARSGQLAQEEADAKAAAARGQQPPVGGSISVDARPNGEFDDIATAMNGFARGQ